MLIWQKTTCTEHPEYLFLWSDESSFSVAGHVASNTMVRYKQDRTGRPRNFNFDKLKDRSTVCVWFAFCEDGQKLLPVRIDGRMNKDQYRQ